MTAQADSLTVLTCVPGKRCAKAYTTDTTQPPSPFDAGFLFSVESVPIASFTELCEALDSLRAMPQCMVIRDQLRADAQPNPAGLYARRRVDRPGDPAPFEHAERRYAMFDADATKTAFDPSDPVGSVERWRASLPPALSKAQLCFQFSAKQHLSETVRGHAWFWLSEPAGNVQLARWATRHGLDPAVFHAVQPLYTADPIFPEGTPDPLEPRALVVLDGEECAELDFTQEDIDASALPSQNGQRLGSIALEEVGNPSDAPAVVDARARLARALAKPFESPGKRWDLCGHVGGLCVNAGIPPEECCGVLELLRAGDVADHDFGQGLRWALGAYSFSAKPLGIRGIKDLLGPITAARVSEAASTLAKALEPEPEPAELEAPGGWGSLPLESFDLATEIEPIDWLIEALQLGPGKPTGLVSYANRSKTPFALELALHIALPKLERFHGHAIQRHVRVLFVTTEGSRNARRKFKKVCIALGTTPAAVAPYIELTSGPPGFLTTEAAAELGERAVANGFGLVIVDTYNSAFDGSADRNTNAFSAGLKVLGDISDRSDVTFLALLHTRKGDRLSWNKPPTLQDVDGHNSVAGALQAAIGLYRRDDEKKNEISVICVREVDDAFEPYEVEWTDTPAPSGEVEGGLRAVVVERVRADSGAADVAEQQRLEVEATAFILELVDAGIAGGGVVPPRPGGATESTLLRSRLAPFGLPQKGPSREIFLHGLVRAGLIERHVIKGNGSVVYVRAGRSAKAAEALAKRTGFLAGGNVEAPSAISGRYLARGRRTG